MPSIVDLVPVIILVLFVVGLVVERVAPARKLPTVRGWYLRAAVSFVATMAINAMLPMLFASWMTKHAPIRLTVLGTWGGALVALVVGEFAGYWLHRFEHRNTTVWRWTHQMHHSAERIDVAGASYFHPFDIAVQTVVTTLVTGLLGVSPAAAAVAGIASVSLAIFQHANIRTPVWLGYLAQRPEGHAVHHQRGVHAYNYGNLAVWDIVFGTWRNPVGFATEAGFYDGSSARVGAMLIGRDIGSPSEAASSNAIAPAMESVRS
jgi:sterol desaturase/sphingolipid hydroxylase (fatty acid hydroxylase superfamily)